MALNISSPQVFFYIRKVVPAEMADTLSKNDVLDQAHTEQPTNNDIHYSTNTNKIGHWK